MNVALRSPVNRMGGKYFLASWLSQHIPQHTLYCEPFCGAGHLLFGKEPSQAGVINDIDNYLVTFFRVIQEPGKCQMLTNLLNYMPYSRSLWQGIRANWKQGNIPQDEIERVAQWYYLNRTCFSGDQLRGGFAVPSTTGRNPITSFRNTIETFDMVAERLRNVCIESLDYTDCIKRYDSEDTLFFCDSPYLNSEHYYGKDSFSQDDHYNLAELLNKVKGKAMVSHYQNSLYDELYKGWNRYEYQSFKGSHKSEGEEKPRTQEVLYCNFQSVRTRSLFDG
ncbi:MAG: DNA adenine methylase [Candidatus Brocadia sp. AMX2]|nr:MULTISPECIES: DNA adenine methylase [Brocadia]MBC6934137.1 DNA adenine methylase [Candidatus Brocadia sp.]MBL1170745.1 DNA adenine methylase [Candidatus Brocadia sp. AMX1]MCK6467986.1 DNA adenine methylase [Candidatus Brocadia sinica]NOG43462.1 DNA adenine methylase [Planctomycetota bacterium]KAA0241148.1 MAG: DNA adenine methylase [Candidatus Brocadia sp. AMX2]